MNINHARNGLRLSHLRQQFAGAVYGKATNGRINHALKAIRRFRSQAQISGSAANRQPVEVRRFQQQIRRRVADFGIEARP